MDYQKLIDAISPEIYQNLKRSVETGKWPDGKVLTSEQRETALQAIIAWDAKHLSEQDRVGYIHKQDKAGDSCDDPEEMPLNWKDLEN